MPSPSGRGYGSTGSGPRSRTAPLGIKLYCVLAALAGVYTMFLSLQIMGAGGPFVSLGFLFFLLSIGLFVVLYGLWTLRPWGWTWGMILFAVNGLFSLLEADLIGVVVSLLLFVYLYSKRPYYR